jgi:hypothetical protein
MLIRSRELSADLRKRRFLKERMTFSEAELQQYFYDEKGFEGEKRFDTMFEILPDASFLKLDDLLLEWNNTTFQIDSFLISQQKTYFFEVKNYEGEWYVDGKKWYWLSGEEKPSPILQLDRSHMLLRQMLRSLDVKLSIEPYVIFVNPEFTLFEAPRDLPIILPTQINRFFKKLSMTSAKPSKMHVELARKIASLHQTDSVYSRNRIPAYSFEKLKKGIGCKGCSSLAIVLDGGKLVCQSCGYNETIQAGIIRSVEEFRLLFPERKMTVTEIIEWCGIPFERKRIQRIMGKKYNLVKKGSLSYYELAVEK